MFEYRCAKEGIYYYDPILRGERFASNTLLFLIGYARVFGDTKVSDKLFLPRYVLNSDNQAVYLPNQSFINQAREYLVNLNTVESLESGDLFELYGLTNVLEQIGFYNFYSSSTKYNSSLNRVPHIPLFTKRSQDYKRIKDILTIEDYWNTEDKWKTEESKENYFEKPSAAFTGPDEYPLYTIYNMNYKGNQGEALDLYKSFGSLFYLEHILYPDEDKPVNEYNDYCSFFIWDSFAFTQLYQFSLGVLYGMSQFGWGTLPYVMRPENYCTYFKYLQFIDEAFFWFQNTPYDLIGSNLLFNIDPRLFKIDTYSNIDSVRLLSSSIDQECLCYISAKMFSLDNGETWITLSELQDWAREHDNALPVNGLSSSLPLYRGSNSFVDLPISYENWVP